MTKHRSRPWLIVSVLCLVAGPLVACAGDSDETRASATRLVVDTDLGVDDVLALAFLAQRDDVELAAVTLSGTGVARCDPGLANLSALLTELERPEVPIACGRVTPLVGTAAYPDDQRDLAADLYGLSVAEARPSEVTADGSASELLSREIRAGATTVLALGPLTNLAEALSADAGLADEIDHLVAMAGAVAVPGNVQAQGPLPVAEWNVYIDPIAAETVFQAGIDVTLVPLDATSDLPLDASVARAVVSLPVSPAADIAQELLTDAPFIWRSGTFSLWDPLAAVLVVQPELATYAESGISVGTGPSDWGATTATGADEPIRHATSAQGAEAAGVLLAGWAGDGREPEALEQLAPDLAVTADATQCDATPLAVGAGDRLVQLRGAGAPTSVALLAIDGEHEREELVALAEAYDGTIPPWLSFVGQWVLPDDAPVNPSLELGAGRYAMACADLATQEIVLSDIVEVGGAG